jgi:hypothetical protein
MQNVRTNQYPEEPSAMSILIIRFVCATSSNGIVETFSNFEMAANVSADLTIWQAAMATLSVPLIFDSVKIGNTSYVSDILSNSNPAARVISEARRLWPGAEDGCFVSVGSFPRIVEASGAGNMAHMLKTMATAAAEEESITRQAEFGASSKVAYFRFTVDNSIDRSALEEWKSPSLIAQRTENYLHSVRTEIQSCAVKLAGISDLKQMDVRSVKSVKLDDQAISHRLKSGGKFINMRFPKNAGFVGRSSELEVLHSYLEKEGRVMLRGLGGSGKTQIAIEYAYRWSEKYSFVLMFDMCSRETELQSYTKIYEKMFPDNRQHNVERLLEPKSNEEVAMVQSCIERNSATDWLLVFDNVDDLESFQSAHFIPSCKAHIILTTRGPLSILRSEIQVGPMTPAESVELLTLSSHWKAEHSSRLRPEDQGILILPLKFYEALVC